MDGAIFRTPLSVTCNDIYMVKMENNVVILFKPMFYRRIVDGIYNKQYVGGNGSFDWLNNYHPDIKLTTEVNPSTFLDTKLINISGAYKFNVYWKNTKLPSPWTSKTRKRNIRNTINGDLHRSKIISSIFDEEIPLIKKKVYEHWLPTAFYEQCS